MHFNGNGVCEGMWGSGSRVRDFLLNHDPSACDVHNQDAARGIIQLALINSVIFHKAPEDQTRFTRSLSSGGASLRKHLLIVPLLYSYWLRWWITAGMKPSSLASSVTVWEETLTRLLQHLHPTAPEPGGGGSPPLWISGGINCQLSLKRDRCVLLWDL